MKDRVEVENWDDLFVVPEAKQVDRNLITQFCMLTSKELKARAVSYHVQNNCKQQNAIQIYVCLMTSLTKVAQDIIVHEAKSYTVVGASDDPYFLRAIITCASTDRRAMITRIRISLSKLYTQMLEFNSDISLFIVYVKQQRDSLLDRGEVSSEIMFNVFKGYEVAADATFCAYILKKRDHYDEGGDLSTDTLMAFSKNKFKSLKVDLVWAAPTPDENCIIALTVQMKAMSASVTTVKG